MKIEVRSELLPDLEKVYCHLVSKHILLETKTVNFKNQKGTFSFTPSFAYAPRTLVYCYFHYAVDYSIQGQLLVINLEDDLPNFVSISEIPFINILLIFLNFLFNESLN